MTIETSKTIKSKKEIELPYFFKLSYGRKNIHYGLLNEAKAVAITEDSITTYFPESVAGNINAENFLESTEEEFNEAFETTMNHIQSMIPVTK